MEKDQTVIYAIGCEIGGLVLMLIFPRILPDPLSYVALVGGFVLLMAGFWIIWASRRRERRARKGKNRWQ